MADSLPSTIIFLLISITQLIGIFVQWFFQEDVCFRTNCMDLRCMPLGGTSITLPNLLLISIIPLSEFLEHSKNVL
uniref:Uncharacterized protein n=1 Tax=Oryza rufipogon TaxID=4529 RepID=A0A0E0PPI2_ORYRU